jgi:excisionase family DNA binding protein
MPIDKNKYPPERRYLTAAEAAEYIGSTESTVRSWTSRRMIPYVKKGRLVRYDREALDKWMQKDAVMPAKAYRD